MATVVDTASMPWSHGADAIAELAPEWRANLGPDDVVAAAYERFHQKHLYDDPATGARCDLVRCDPGYADATYAYHDTVEEGFCLAGSADLPGEGEFAAWHYFWRPPGYVHAAFSPDGFTALLMCEGENEAEGSRATTRRVRPAEEAGTNALEQDPERAAGPRGCVRPTDTRLLPWEPLAPGVDVKTLSRNAGTGAHSSLVRLAPGSHALLGPHELQVSVIEGTLALAHLELAEGVYARLGADDADRSATTSDGALLFVKSTGPLSEA